MKSLPFLVFLFSIQTCLLNIQAQSPFPDFPPKEVSSEMDRDQMLYQLGISLPVLPPKLEDPNAPPDAYPRDSLNPQGNWRDDYGHTIVRSAWGLWNNYHDISAGFFPGTDSARLGAYTPINLLKMKNGRSITTAAEWWHGRRAEILKDVQEQMYGAIPPDSLLPAVTWTVTTSRGGKGNAAYLEKEIKGIIDVARYPEVRDRPVISATLRIPQGLTESVPVMVRIGGGFGNATESLWQQAYPHGWGICIFNPGDLQPDNGAGLTSYLIGLVNKGNWRKPNDWGTLAAWSWGISKLIDYFETDKDTDATKIGLTGHSRYGKATLLTMAYEPRLAIAFPSDGGSLGTTLNRRHWGQDLENSGGANEYHWMAGSFYQWAGELIPGQYLPRKIENCPVDAHCLVALCAPRPLLLNGGTQSSWTDPYGQYLTTLYASPVYELLGKKGIVMPDKKPQIDIGYIDGDLAYRYHEGGHTDAPEWPTFFQFASKYIKAPILATSANALTLTDKAKSSAVLKVTSNDDWQIFSSAPWLRLSQNTGSQNDSLQVIAKKNRAKTARTAMLKLTTKGKVQHVMVNQASSEPALAISETELAISGTGNNIITFDIYANTAWHVSGSEDWLTINQEAGVNDYTITLIASDNPRVEKRSAKLTISALDLSPQNITITQSEGMPTLRVSATSLQVNAAANSSATSLVFSNTTCTVESSEPWLQASINQGNRFSRLTVIAQKNSTMKERQAIVTLKVKDLPPQTIVVTQSASLDEGLEKIGSRVFGWSSLEVEKKETGERRSILEGSTTHLAYFEIHATTLLPKNAPHPPHVHADEEEMIIVKEGMVEVTIEKERKILGPGSIALILPGDAHGFSNAGDSQASYYVLKYNSKMPMDIERGKKAGGSFMVNWEDVAFREHGKGGRRDFFDRPTTMCEDFEMHVTNLNENTQSHPPHTHEVEEIILMITGDVEMHIDGDTPKATSGDLIFLDSQIPHAPTNIGVGQSIYFAFQWK